jgi:hypothetical protein
LTAQFDEPNWTAVGGNDPRDAAIDASAIWTIWTALCREASTILPKLREITFDSAWRRPFLTGDGLISFVEARHKAVDFPQIAVIIASGNWLGPRKETLELLKGKLSRLSQFTPGGEQVYLQ